MTMNNTHYGFRILVLLSLIFFMGFIDRSGASVIGSITDVKLSSDARRLVIEADGPFDRHRVRTASQPNRLIVDLDGAKVSPTVHIHTPSGKAVREIRVGMTDKGSRVVADFGASPIPEHRTLRMKDSILVMFRGSSQPEERALDRSSGRISRQADRAAETRPRVYKPVATRSIRTLR